MLPQNTSKPRACQDLGDPPVAFRRAFRDLVAQGTNYPFPELGSLEHWLTQRTKFRVVGRTLRRWVRRLYFNETFERWHPPLLALFEALGIPGNKPSERWASLRQCLTAWFELSSRSCQYQVGDLEFPEALCEAWRQDRYIGRAGQPRGTPLADALAFLDTLTGGRAGGGIVVDYAYELAGAVRFPHEEPGSGWEVCHAQMDDDRQQHGIIDVATDLGPYLAHVRPGGAVFVRRCLNCSGGALVVLYERCRCLRKVPDPPWQTGAVRVLPPRATDL